MTHNMRQVLEQAAKQELRKTPTWPANPTTLAALVRHGFLSRSRRLSRSETVLEVWSITEEGKVALKPRERFRVEQPLYMARGAVRYCVLPNGRWGIAETEHSGDYTTDPHKSVDREGSRAVPVLVRPEDLDRFTAAARKKEHDEKRQRGERLDSTSPSARVVRLERVARNRRADITNELRLIRHMLSGGRTQHALQRIAQLEVGLGQRAA